MQKSTKSDMPRRQTLFWDVNPATIDPDKHAKYIVERILDFGHDNEVRWMWQQYPHSFVRSIVESSRVLHPQTRVLWEALTREE